MMVPLRDDDVQEVKGPDGYIGVGFEDSTNR